jgi:hypothetical protein
VWNSDSGTLDYTITDDVGWLSVSPTSGSSTGEHDTITVSYDTSGLTAGTYNGTITITDTSATNSPQSVPVSLTVNSVVPAATIALNPTSLSTSCDEGNDASSQTFDLWNSGSGTLNYSMGSSSNTAVFGNVPGAHYPNTIQDTYINVNATNYSTDPALRTYTWPANTAANRTIIKWDLSAIPAGATIQSATLDLYMYGSGGDAIYEISAHKIVNHNPLISACNWNTYDGVNSWTGGSNGGAQQLEWIRLLVTRLGTLLKCCGIG